jgi:DNA adenine methylase
MTSSQNVLTAISPTEPAAAWIGGKRLLAQRICAILATTPHAAYCEPFVGMGGVFLRRAMRPRVEVINDAAGDVVTLFRVIQRHPEALFRELRWRPAARSEFDRLRGQAPEQLTDVERAARFLYLQTLAYAGKVQGRSFGFDPAQGCTFSLARLEPRLRKLHARLDDVSIEHADWSDFIPRYDRATTLFYLDPPYWGSEGDYGSGLFGPADFDRLAHALSRIEGRFLLSINDVPEIRTAFAWADIEPVTTRYTIAGGSQPAAELLIGRGVNLTAAAPQASLL